MRLAGYFLLVYGSFIFSYVFLGASEEACIFGANVGGGAYILLTSRG